MRRDLFDDDHELYRESIRAFIEQEIVPNYAEWERAGIVPRELFTRLGELGRSRIRRSRGVRRLRRRRLPLQRDPRRGGRARPRRARRSSARVSSSTS